MPQVPSLLNAATAACATDSTAGVTPVSVPTDCLVCTQPPSCPDWWRAQNHRGMALDADGRWDYLPQKTQQLGAAVAAAPAKVAAGAAQAKAQA